MPVVYIDILFLINFVLDSGLLLVTSRLSGKSPHPFRIISGGLLGGVYACSIFFINISFWGSYTIKIIISAIMIFIVFFPFSKKEFVRHLINFYVQTFLLGGLLSATFYFSGRPAVMSNNIYYFPFSTFQLLILALPLIFALSYYWKKSKNKLLSYGKYCNITIKYNGKTFCAEGLLDSGCSLCDPLSGKPVIILDSSCSADFFGKDVAMQIKKGDFTNLLISGKFRIIPFSTVSTQSGNMPAFIPDVCFLLFDKQKIVCDCAVAFSPSFSGNFAIINPDVLAHQGNFGGILNEL